MSMHTGLKQFSMKRTIEKVSNEGKLFFHDVAPEVCADSAIACVNTLSSTRGSLLLVPVGTVLLQQRQMVWPLPPKMPLD